MPRRRSLPASAVLVMMVAVVLALSGCQVPFGPQAHVSGTVYGEEIAAREAGKSVPIPLQATVTCNGVATAAASGGTFSLTVSQASNYNCTATASRYSSVTAHFSGNGSAFALRFGPKRSSGCDNVGSPPVLTCSVLAPATATLRGSVTDVATDKTLAHVTVQCWNAARDITTNDGSSRITTTTDDLGSYVFHDVAVDPYGCVAGNDETLQTTKLTPGNTTTLDISACVSGCSSFKYHQGTVIHHLTAYLIFWLPKASTFEPNGSSARFEGLMSQYFRDIGGTPFYNILSQYYDAQGGPVRNEVTLGGTYVDTQPYPVAGTQADPLLDGDVVHEINRVLDAKHGQWKSDDEHMVYLFTGYNVQECSGVLSSDGCTFTRNAEADFCAYHSNSFNTNLIYAYIPDVNGCLDLPAAQSPNGDPVADAVISTVSHEQFEAVSNPTLGGWFDGASREGEMGDKCVRIYGPLAPDNSNVTLNHGHHYIVQEEWSLRDQGCVLALS